MKNELAGIEWQESRHGEDAGGEWVRDVLRWSFYTFPSEMCVEIM
jgi:hypothetical protein